MGLLSAIGGLIGFAVGGPMGAAFGSGIGTLASGGDIGDALKSGLMGFGIGSIPGIGQALSGGASALGMQGLAGQFASQTGAQGALGQILGGAGGQAAAGGAAAGTNPLANILGGGAKAAGGAAGSNLTGGILGFAQNNPLVMASLLQAAEPSQDMLSPEQKRQLATGERLPDYQGTAAPDYRYQRRMAQGGYIEGPGTGTSDSIPARIYQNGGPVQEARLSDGEFVMTADAVRGMGNGNRNMGAARMYEMMNRLERRA